ncbi:hypothetical protein, partial [Salmonella sp. SAL4438]|uniref:hypothetical protein n=1 Tax=Salmonella sp. SAL4438 TaxID=3159893 RepID=UPI00397ADF19
AGTETLQWDQFGANLPNVIVTDLRYVPQTTIPGTTTKTGDLLLAGTLGRGVWSISGAAAKLNQESTLTLTGNLADDVV